MAISDKAEYRIYELDQKPDVFYNVFKFDRSPRPIAFPKWVTESKCKTRTQTVIEFTQHGIVRHEKKVANV